MALFAVCTLGIKPKKLLDELELAMSEFPIQECPLNHTFVEGMYIREIFMPKGTLITSKIHKTRHPYEITKGKVLVRINEEEWEHLEAPYMGITESGTRRVLYILEDTLWTTYHLTDKKTVDEVEADIIEKHDNPLLSEDIKNKFLSLSRYGLDKTKTIQDAY